MSVGQECWKINKQWSRQDLKKKKKKTEKSWQKSANKSENRGLDGYRTSEWKKESVFRYGIAYRKGNPISKHSTSNQIKILHMDNLWLTMAQ